MKTQFSRDQLVPMVSSIFQGAIDRIVLVVPTHLPKAEFQSLRDRFMFGIMAVLGTVNAQLAALCTQVNRPNQDFDQYDQMLRAAEIFLNELQNGQKATFMFQPTYEAEKFVTKYME